MFDIFYCYGTLFFFYMRNFYRSIVFLNIFVKKGTSQTLSDQHKFSMILNQSKAKLLLHNIILWY